MPYVPINQRLALGRPLHNLVEAVKDLPEDQRDGALNYCFTQLILLALLPPGGWRYRSLQGAYGLLHCCASEFYRRMIGPYEDGAIAKNGDVFGRTAPHSDYEDDLCDE